MLTDVLNQIDSIVWGPWLLVLLVGTGVYLSIRLGFLQVMKLPRALKLIFFARNKGEGDIDSFKALCTALAATVGTGNIVGVATAIKLGGPRSPFLDVAGCFLRNGYEIFGRVPGRQIP